MTRIEDRRIQIPASDGFLLAATVLEPTAFEPTVFEHTGTQPTAPNPAEAQTFPTVIINSATAVKRGYYLRFAQFLAEAGFRVVTFDYRGIGGSRPAELRGFDAKMQDWAEKDTEGVLRWVADQFPNEPIFLIGHSFGGQAMALTPSYPRLRGVVTVAAQSGYWGHWPVLSLPRVLFFWYVLIPLTCRLWGYFPAKSLGISEDLPAGVALQWARWGKLPNYLLGDPHGDTEPSWKENFSEFDRPILAYSFSDDFFAPPKAAASIQRSYRTAAIAARPRKPKDYGVKKIGHWGFFREKFRDSLWTETLEWLRASC